MKGRANYACRQKIYDAEKEAVLDGLEEVADFQIIREWEKTTEIGDRAEIKTLPESSTAWAKIDARRELCSGQKCPQFERCFITLMHQRAAESDIIIVNHHLFFADLAVKDEDVAGIMPEYDAVIFDEAHEIEDVAGQYFGVQVSNYRFQELRRDIAGMSRQKAVRLAGTRPHPRTAGSNCPSISSACSARPKAARASKTARRSWTSMQRTTPICLPLLSLPQSHLKLLKKPPEEVIPLIRRAEELHAGLKFGLESDDSDFVYWIERRGRGCFLQATPIDVSATSGRAAFRQARHRRPDLGHARRGRNVRIRQTAPGPAATPAR